MEEQPKSAEPILTQLLSRAKELYPKQVKAKEGNIKTAQDEDDWSTLTAKQSSEPELTFIRSKMVDSKMAEALSKQKEDRCNQSRMPKGVPLKPTKCRISRFNHDDGRPSAAAEPNLIHTLLARTPRRDNSQAFKKLKTYEEVARRSLTAISQLDALKNLMLVAMTKQSESGTDREWAESADPNLLLQILEGQHLTIEYLAELASYLLADTTMDRRQATLEGSSIPREIQKNLMAADLRERGLWAESDMEKAKKDLESDALTRPFRRPSSSSQRPRPSQSHFKGRMGDWPKKTSDLSKIKSSSRPHQANSQSPRQQHNFGAPAFGSGLTGPPSFPRQNFQRGKPHIKRK